MLFSTLFRRWAQSAGRAPAVPAPHRSFAPRLEALEDRCTPSTLTVTTLNDTGVTGDGSLRGTVAAAAPGDTIVFAPGLEKAQSPHGHTGTIDLNSTLVLSKNVTLQGLTDSSNHPLLTLSGQNQVRDLIVNSGVTASLSGLTITNGFMTTPGNGGAGIHNLGSLTLTNVAVTNNFAQGMDIALGGGIFNSGTLTIQNSTITGNSAGSTSAYGPGDGGFITGLGGGFTTWAP